MLPYFNSYICIGRLFHDKGLPPTTFVVILHFSRTFHTNSLWKNCWMVYAYKHYKLVCLHLTINSSTGWLYVIYVLLIQTKMIIWSHKEMFYVSNLAWKKLQFTISNYFSSNITLFIYCIINIQSQDDGVTYVLFTWFIVYCITL